MDADRLGPFRIERELGSGGMGKVYAGIVVEPTAGLASGDAVALKVVHPHLLENPDFHARFLREAELGASIAHPNVVRTLGCDEEGDGPDRRCYLVMEFVEGQTLADLQAELDRVPEDLCRHVAREICAGLAAVHDAGIVHRDLKPENVLITPEQTIKVMDLGVARLMDERMRLSRTGAFVGSVEYAAPEQFGGEADARTDLYALGLLLYELAAGEHPHRGGGFTRVLQRVIHEEPRRLGQVNPQLSAFFEELVHKLLAKDADERFQTAREVAAVLEAGEDSPWWSARASRLRAATRRPLRRIRIPRESALHGRGAELARLREAFDGVLGGDGRVILVEGEAGIGKSRLIDEFVAALHSEGRDLDFLHGSFPPSGAGAAGGAFSTAFRAQLGDDDLTEYLPDTPGLAPALAAALRGDVPPDGIAPLSPEALATCLVQATRAIAARRPIVLLIDDLHFAPHDAHDLFLSLATAVPGHPVLLIGTARPGLADEWIAKLARLEHARRIPLQRLGQDDVERLLADSLRSDTLARRLAPQVAEKSDGNPFFVFELVRGLREGQFLERRDDGTWVSTRAIDDIRVPSSIRDLVVARVAGLDEEDRDLLDLASCLGFEFDPGLVGEVLGLRRIPLLKQLGRLERSRRLVRSAGMRYVFDHHQVQEVLYDELAEPLRREYHAAIAEVLLDRAGGADTDPSELDGDAAVAIAEHFVESGRLERATPYLSRAIHHLADRYRHERALALAEPFLDGEELDDLAALRLRLSLPQALHSQGRLDDLLRVTEEAVALARRVGDETWLGRALVSRGDALSRIERWQESETALEEALEHGDDPLITRRALSGLGIAAWGLGRLDVARERFQRHLAVAEDAGDVGGQSSSVANLALIATALGDFEDAVALRLRDVELSRRSERPRDLGLALHNLGLLLGSCGSLTDALRHLEASLPIWDEVGDRPMVAHARLGLGHTRARLASETGTDPSVARHDLELARDLADDVGPTWVATVARAELAALPSASEAERADAITEFERRREELSDGSRRQIGLALWRATGDRAYIEAAKKLLDDWLRGLPAERRDDNARTIRLARDILAAWNDAHGTPRRVHDPARTEAQTRVVDPDSEGDG